MADVSKIKLPNGTTYTIKDNNALPLTGGSVTGPVSFGDSVTIDEATIGDLVVNGNGSFTNNIQANTINGVEVGAAPSFTDTVTTVTTTGSGNAVTAISASNGALTVTKGSTFSTSDTKVTQSYKTASEYTYWRPLLIGYASGSTASFTPTDQTNLAYTFATLKVQPSTGTIRVNNLALYKGSYTTTFTPTTLTADRTITIPDKAGTMALTSDITSAIEDLPEPMIFKGSVGSNGTVTWANLATAAAANEGWTYKVITTHTAETGKPAAQVGDTIISNGTEWVVIPSGDEPSGTVTSVAASNATNGGLTISGSPITSSGTITIGHSNVLSSAQTTQAVYPIKIDKNGHISAYGSAVTIPTVPSATGSATTGITIAAHGTGTVIGVQSSTTTVRGVKTGTSSTTTASHVKSGGNGTAPTLGTAISIYGVKSGTGSTTTASHVKSGGNGTAPTLGTAISLIGVQSTTTTASKVTVGSHSTDYGVKSAGSGSFTQGTFNGGSGSASLTFTMDTTDTKKLVISFSHTHTPATHGADSHTHTAPTLGSKVPTVSASNVTVPIKNTSATSIPNVTSAGSASTWVFEDVTVPIRADSATSIPNVTSVGSASNWAFEDITVPIRADADTTVPIKNTSASTFVTGTTHTVTDNGHTHTI